MLLTAIDRIRGQEGITAIIMAITAIMTLNARSGRCLLPLKY